MPVRFSRSAFDLRISDFLDGGAEGVRTPDLLNAIQALYQLSYDPVQSVLNVFPSLNLSKPFYHFGAASDEALPNPL